MSSMAERIVSFFTPLVWNDRTERFQVDAEALGNDRVKYVVRGMAATVASLALGNAFLPTSTTEYSALGIVIGVTALIAVCVSTVTWHKVATMTTEPAPRNPSV